jgi:hypothetical protein
MRLPGRHGSCRCLCRADEPGLGNNPGPDLVENGPADKTIRVLNAKTLEQKANLAFDGNPEDMLWMFCAGGSMIVPLRRFVRSLAKKRGSS